MQKLPDAPDRKRSDAWAKERNLFGKRRKLILFQQWPVEWQHLNLFLQLVEGTMRPSVDDAFANLSTSSSGLFNQRPMTKNTK